MAGVLVSNGCADTWVLEKALPYIDAMNIDLKSFSKETYSKVLGGDLDQVKDFIKRAAKDTHLELTTLIVPGVNDDISEIEAMGKWIASLDAKEDIVWHITRFFPRFKMDDGEPTPVPQVYDFAEIARKYVRFVYTGNC